MKKFDVVKCANRAEWLNFRASGIGASEISAVMGVNPWMTSYALYAKKNAGGNEDDALANNAAVKAGHFLEDAVARYYQELSGRHVIKNSAGDWIAIDPEHPWRICSPDRTFFVNGNGGERGVLECKTCRKPLDKNNLPLHYYCQVQWQLGILGYRLGVLAWLANGLDFDYVEIEFDPEFFAKLTAAADEWWHNFQNDIPPTPTTAADVRTLFPSPVADYAVADEVAAADWNSLKLFKEQIKGLQLREQELTDKLCQVIGDKEGIVTEGADGRREVLATFKAQNSSRLDSARLKKEHPDIYEEYVKTSSTRVFRLK